MKIDGYYNSGNYAGNMLRATALTLMTGLASLGLNAQWQNYVNSTKQYPIKDIDGDGFSDTLEVVEYNHMGAKRKTCFFVELSSEPESSHLCETVYHRRPLELKNPEKLAKSRRVKLKYRGRNYNVHNHGPAMHKKRIRIRKICK